jgi:hypothetical protein
MDTNDPPSHESMACDDAPQARENGSISGGNPGNSAVVITGIKKPGLGVHKLGHDFSSHLLPGFIAHNCDALGHAG